MKAAGSALREFVKRNTCIIVLVTGGLLITGWTLLRFFTEASIFDLVGQQVFAQELLRGAGDATLGATHYLLKVFLLYIPLVWLEIPPRAALIGMTLFINITSYILIAFALKKILAELSLRTGKYFYIGLLWLAAFAGSIFWIEFSNSRNIEVAAGVWLIALGLSWVRSPSRLLAIGLFSLAVLTFYIDPLQIFMTAVPLAVFITLQQYKKKDGRRKVVIFGLILLGAYAISLLLLALSKVVIGVDFVSTGGLAVSAVLNDIVSSVRQLGIANVRLFAGTLEDGGRVRQGVALIATCIVVITWIILAFKKRFKSVVVQYVIIFFVVIQAVYLLSGQSLNGDTSRYLIMLAPLFVILISAFDSKRADVKAVKYSLIVAIIANGLFVVGALFNSFPERFTKDAQLDNIADYSQAQKTTTVFASMDIALPTMYYRPKVTILPLACEGDRLVTSSTFYPKTSFRKQVDLNNRNEAIVIADGQITNYPNTCSKEDIVAQFGTPASVTALSTGKVVLIYPGGVVSERL